MLPPGYVKSILWLGKSNYKALDLTETLNNLPFCFCFSPLPCHQYLTFPEALTSFLVHLYGFLGGTSIYHPWRIHINFQKACQHQQKSLQDQGLCFLIREVVKNKRGLFWFKHKSIKLSSFKISCITPINKINKNNLKWKSYTLESPICLFLLNNMINIWGERRIISLLRCVGKFSHHLSWLLGSVLLWTVWEAVW